MAKNLEELRQENPALAEALMTEARAAVSAAGKAGDDVSASNTDPIQAERKRLQEIDAVAALYDDETVGRPSTASAPALPRR